MKSNHENVTKGHKKSKKQSYMSEQDSEKEILGRRLKASELPFIVQRYADKFGISIHINGQHDSVKSLWSDIDKNTAKNIYDYKHSKDYSSLIAHREIADYRELARHQKNRLVKKEILNIQNTLHDNEYVGYVFTDGEEKSDRHFEVVIISKNKIIKPVDFGSQKNNTGATIIEHKLSDELKENLFTVNFPGMELIKPQSTTKECGTLGLLYLKELLKDQANHLQHYSMIFKSEGKNYFFPAPQPLCYSQSNYFNLCLRAMLEEGKDHEVEVTKGKKTTKVTTLKDLLEKNPDNAILLKEFEDFKSRWINAYDEAMEKSKVMQSPNGHNQYLSYRSQSINKEMRLYKAENAHSKPHHLGGWNAGNYYLLLSTPPTLYYVDNDSKRHPVERTDLDNLLKIFYINTYTVLGEKELQHLNLTAHHQFNTVTSPESSSPLESTTTSYTTTTNSFFARTSGRADSVKEIEEKEEELKQDSSESNKYP